MTLKRCAIYTRKSTEEGLEQSFNSLDAQSEACAAYIVSQAHEGWEEIHEHYADGGWSGGNMTLAELPTNQEFALVVTRRNAAGVHEVVALVSDDAMLDRALRKAAS